MVKMTDAAREAFARVLHEVGLVDGVILLGSRDRTGGGREEYVDILRRRDLLPEDKPIEGDVPMAVRGAIPATTIDYIEGSPPGFVFST